MFEALESAGYVNIQKQAGLVSFEGLEKVIVSWKMRGLGLFLEMVITRLLSR